MSFTVNDIKSQILGRLNDPDQTRFTDATLLPYAKDAGDELQLELELNGLLMLETISLPFVVPINTRNLTALLPADLLDPQRLQERLSGSQDLYTPMVRREWEPNILPTDSLRYWVWRENTIFTVGATSVRDVEIFYLKRAINIVDLDTVIPVNNGQQFMVNRIAALASEFGSEDKTRADSLNTMAIITLNKVTGIEVKSKQGARTRRRPFVLAGRRRWC